MPQSQITWFYYRDLDEASEFYEMTLGLERVLDQGWTRVYRTGVSSFLGLVSGEMGFKQPQAESAVLISLIVDDVDAWHAHLQGKGVRFLRDLGDFPAIRIRNFFIQDPGGYAVEIQQFMDPEHARIFTGI
jgi:predicted enzyme related to lactoylglutathione lyase